MMNVGEMLASAALVVLVGATVTGQIKAVRAAQEPPPRRSYRRSTPKLLIMAGAALLIFLSAPAAVSAHPGNTDSSRQHPPAPKRGPDRPPGSCERGHCRLDAVRRSFVMPFVGGQRARTRRGWAPSVFHRVAAIQKRAYTPPRLRAAPG